MLAILYGRWIWRAATKHRKKTNQATPREVHHYYHQPRRTKSVPDKVRERLEEAARQLQDDGE